LPVLRPSVTIASRITKYLCFMVNLSKLIDNCAYYQSIFAKKNTLILTQSVFVLTDIRKLLCFLRAFNLQCRDKFCFKTVCSPPFKNPRHKHDCNCAYIFCQRCHELHCFVVHSIPLAIDNTEQFFVLASAITQRCYRE
jgi:hypothetical protein